MSAVIFLLTILVLVLLLYIAISYIKLLKYWNQRGVKNVVRPLPLIGNLLPTITQRLTLSEYVDSLYSAFPKERYCGIFQFGQPILLIRDPELIRTIAIKEFNSFSDHAINFNPDEDPIWGNNLFATRGTKWKHLRHTLSPVFTSKKLKNMYVLMEDYTKRFIDHLKNQNKDVLEVELDELIKRYSMDIIATTAFGLETNAATDKDEDFFKMGLELTDFSGVKKFRFILYNSSAYLAKIFNFKMISDHVANFFDKIIKHTIAVRTKEGIYRPDLIQLLMEARQGKLHIDEISGSTIKESDAISKQKEFAMNLTDIDITAQAVAFIFAGYDTTSRLILFTLYELAVNTEVQDRLRKEVDDSFDKSTDKISYEDLFKMKYMDMVVSETLRKWPISFLDRKTVSPFTIEPERATEKPVHLKVGDLCWFPTYALHRDPKYWTNPESFDPERFSEENRGKIVQGAYIPFGIGPRNCIGSRYAVMETKLVLSHLLANFEIVPTSKSKIPVVISKNDLFMTPVGGLWLGLKKR